MQVGRWRLARVLTNAMLHAIADIFRSVHPLPDLRLRSSRHSRLKGWVAGGFGFVMGSLAIASLL